MSKRNSKWYMCFDTRLPGPCITNVFATRRKNFSQWHRSFQRKLLSHWLKFLRHVAKTLVIQGPVLFLTSSAAPTTRSDNGDDETTSAVLTTTSDDVDDKNDDMCRSTISFYKLTCTVGCCYRITFNIIIGLRCVVLCNVSISNGLQNYVMLVINVWLPVVA